MFFDGQNGQSVSLNIHWGLVLKIYRVMLYLHKQDKTGGRLQTEQIELQPSFRKFGLLVVTRSPPCLGDVGWPIVAPINLGSTKSACPVA